MVHYVFWLFSGGAPASQPTRGGWGFQSLPATQPQLGAAPSCKAPNECFLSYFWVGGEVEDNFASFPCLFEVGLIALPRRG